MCTSVRQKFSLKLRILDGFPSNFDALNPNLNSVYPCTDTILNSMDFLNFPPWKWNFSAFFGQCLLHTSGICIFPNSISSNQFLFAHTKIFSRTLFNTAHWRRRLYLTQQKLCFPICLQFSRYSRQSSWLSHAENFVVNWSLICLIFVILKNAKSRFS
jgi:hypothetical protein